VTKEDAAKLVDDREVHNDYGRPYKDETTGMWMVEYHVDDSEILFKKAQETYIFGGALSIFRDKDKKPLVLFGQDECIFKQYLVKGKHWRGKEGKVPMYRKDDSNLENGALNFVRFLPKSWQK
jgi:hypothetical protein